MLGMILNKIGMKFFVHSMMLLGICFLIVSNTKEQKTKSVQTAYSDDFTKKSVEFDKLHYLWVKSYRPKSRKIVEINCLAQNIYFEARNTEYKEQLAVAFVTKNRILSGDFPDNFCDVVHQPNQFSWTKMSKRYRSIKDLDSWKSALKISESIINEEIWYDNTHGATHYYAYKLINSPKWAKLDGYDVITMDNHKYMKLAARNK